MILRHMWNLLPCRPHQALQEGKKSGPHHRDRSSVNPSQSPADCHRTSAIEMRQCSFPCSYSPVERSRVIGHREKVLDIVAGDKKVMVKSSSWKEVLCRSLGERSIEQVLKLGTALLLTVLRLLKIWKFVAQSHQKIIIVEVLLIGFLPRNQCFQLWSCAQSHTRPQLLPFLHTTSTILKAIFFFKTINFFPYMDLLFFKVATICME